MNRKDVVKRCFKEPEYHARIMKRPLLPPQSMILDIVERELRDPRSQMLTVRSSRQTTKNEVSARYHARHLLMNGGYGGNIVRAAPTFRPQIINSMLRLEDVLKGDPLAYTGSGKKKRKRWRKQYGFMFTMGKAGVTFFSADKEANVVGGTASHALDIDEAHLVDREKFEEDFEPMAAWKGVPTIMWGVAAYRQDMLYHHRSMVKNAKGAKTRDVFGDGTITESSEGVAIDLPAEVWCEFNPQYAQHFETRLRRLGENHPVILTQYKLVDLERGGGFFSDRQLQHMFSGDHEMRFQSPGSGMFIGALDIGGEADEDELALAIATGSEETLDHDAAVMMVAEVDFDMEFGVTGQPLTNVVYGRQWIGTPIDEVQRDVEPLLPGFRIQAGRGDANGVGAQIVPSLNKKWPNFEVHKPTGKSNHEDCSNLMAMLNNDRFRMWRGDDEFHKAARKQCGWVQKTINRHEYITMVKPKAVEGVSHPRIDIPRTMSYLASVACSFAPIEDVAGY